MKLKTKIKILILIIFVSILTGCKERMPISEKSAREKVLTTLKERYNEEFEVKTFTYSRYNKSYELEVYPKKNQKIVFKARMLSQNGYRVSERYTEEEWYMSMEKLLEPYVNKIGKKRIYYAGILPLEDKLYFKLLDNNVKFKEVKEKHAKDSLASATIYVFRDVTPQNREEILKSVYELIKFIKDEGFKTGTLNIEFYDEKYFADKDINKLLEISTWNNFSDNYKRYCREWIWIREEKEFEKIKNYRNIKMENIKEFWKRMNIKIE